MLHLDVYGGAVYTPSGMVHEACICVKEGRIAAITDAPCTDGTVTDVSGKTVIPGLIDIHMHGAFGWDASVSPPDEHVLVNLARLGTTSVLPTIYPVSSRGDRISVLQSYRERLKDRRNGYHMLGIHMEGPFLNPELGAQLPEWCESAEEGEFDAYLREYGDLISMMSLSPELPGSERLVKALADRGIVAATAHSAADGTAMRHARSAGLRHGTHIFNATRRPDTPFSGCISPDVNDFCLTDEEMTVDVVVDGQSIHMDDVLLKLAWRCKGPDRLLLISDSMMVAGLPPGVYDSKDGRKLVIDSSDVCYFEDGTICGSKMMLLYALKNLMARLNLSLEEALPAVTSNPARLLGITDRKGSIVPGLDADLVILDESLNVHLAMVEGRMV